jgi:hypothetical protein
MLSIEVGKKVNPQNPLVHFYMAEEMRPEMNGKITAVGIYPDHKMLVNLPKDAPNPTVELPSVLKSLSFLFNISSFVGEITVAIDLDVNGIRRSFIKPTKYDSKEPGKSINIVAAMEPCIVNEFGLRKFIVNIDGNEYLFDYEISRAILVTDNLENKSKISADPVIKKTTKLKKVLKTSK